MSRDELPPAREEFSVVRMPAPDGPFRGVELGSGRFKFDFGDFSVFAAAEIHDHTLRITAMDIRAEDVTSAVHRAVPIRELRAEIERQFLAHDFAAALAGNLRATERGVPEELALAEKRAEEAVQSLKPGHPARVAMHYLDAYGRDPRQPLVLMAEELGRSRNTIAGWVKKARDDGWLTRESGEPGRDNQQGRPGGMPGPRLVEWLQEKEDQ